MLQEQHAVKFILEGNDQDSAMSLSVGYTVAASGILILDGWKRVIKRRIQVKLKFEIFLFFRTFHQTWLPHNRPMAVHQGNNSMATWACSWMLPCWTLLMASFCVGYWHDNQVEQAQHNLQQYDALKMALSSTEHRRQQAAWLNRPDRTERAGQHMSSMRRSTQWRSSR